MYNINFTKTLTAGVALALASCPQAFACESGYIEGLTTKNCIPASGTCGDGCSYTLDSKGNLTITGDGTGIISNGAFRGNTDIKNVNISGIKKMEVSGGGTYTFLYAGAGGGTIKINEPMEDFCSWAGNFSTIEVNSSKFKTNWNGGSYTLSSKNLKTLIIPDNLINNIESSAFLKLGNDHTIHNINIQCKGDVKKCEAIVASAKNSLVNIDGGTLNIDFWKGYDEDGNWNEWSEKGLTVYDEDGNPIAVYGFDRKLVSSYSYNPDGSVSITDANGKLTGLKNAKSITPAQAAALVKKCNCNTVKLTFK